MGSVALRSVEDGDLDALFEMGRDPEAVRMAAFTRPDPGNRAAFDAHMARVRESATAEVWVVTLDGRVVGSVGAFVMEGENEITYWIDRAWWGKGVATRAVALLLELVVVRPLYARAVGDNAGSIRVLEKSGFRVVGGEVAYAAGRGGEVEETILRLD